VARSSLSITVINGPSLAATGITAGCTFDACSMHVWLRFRCPFDRRSLSRHCLLDVGKTALGGASVRSAHFEDGLCRDIFIWSAARIAALVFFIRGSLPPTENTK